MCLILFGADARGEDVKPQSRSKSAHVHSGVKSFGHKVKHAFMSVGGHLQKFFTGRDTISR